MPFGFGKKKDDGDEANRNALFGSKKGKGEPASNPYAQAQPGSDPYMDPNKFRSPKEQARAHLENPSIPVNRQNSVASNATAPPPYASEPPAPQGYGNDRYGASSGYGANKYASQGGYGGGRAGGYGGLGGGPSDDTDANRDALLGGARQRQQQSGPSSGAATSSYGQPSPAGGADSGKYGGYGEQREMTAEDEEAAYVDDLNRQRKEIVQQSVQSTQNSARYKNEALDAAMSTYARLGVQHERLTNTEKLLDHGAISSREAKTSTAELKRLNGSMFNPNLKNPFTKSKRKQEADQRVLDETREDRAQRLGTRADGYQASQREEAGFREIERARNNNAWKPSSKAERSKYMFEEDDEDEANEDEIDRNLQDIAGGVSQLNVAAKLIGQELDSQNQLIDRLGNKSEALHDQTALNTARLNRIR